MTIEKIMTKAVVTVAMNDPLSVIHDIFENTSFHHLVVVESGKVVGIISDRDLFKALSPNLGTVAESVKDTATLNKKAHQIMSRQVIALAPSASIYQAIALFNCHDISCIPIVEGMSTTQDKINDSIDDECDEKLVGILSWRDIFKALEAQHKE